MGTSETLRADRWRAAFARQSAADRRAYELLSRSSGVQASRLPVCHRLQFLQMHLEKLAKAFLCGQQKTDAEIARIQRTHNVIAKALPMLVKQYWSQISETRKPRPAEVRRLRDLCFQIDLLAPAVDLGQTRRDNCEYPWADMQEGEPVVVAPCDHSFSVISRIYSRDASVLLKAAEIACRDLQRTETLE